MRMMPREALEEDGYTVEAVAAGAGIWSSRRGRSRHLDVNAGPRRPGHAARDQATTPSPHVITIHRVRLIDTAIRAVKLGASTTSPTFRRGPVDLSVQKAGRARLRSEFARLRDRSAQLPVGQHHRQSAVMQSMFARSAGCRLDGVVLVTGASGTGKSWWRRRCTSTARAAIAPSSRSTRRVPRRCWRAAVRLQAGASSPRARIAPASSSKRTAASSSTRSPSCRPRCAAAARVLQEGEIRPLARRAARWTCGWWRRPTRIWRT